MGATTSVALGSSGLARFKKGRPENSSFNSQAADTAGTVGGAGTPDILSVPIRDNPPASAKSSVIPVTAILLAGKTSMSNLSTLANGVLVNCIPNGTNADNGAVTVSVALPKASARPRSTEKQWHTSQSMSYKSDDLNKVDIPQAPFDPFDSSSGSRGDNAPGMSPLSDLRLSESGNDAANESLDSRSQVDDSRSEAEDVTDVRNGLGTEEMKAPKDLGQPFNNLSKITHRDTGFGVGTVPASPPLSHSRASSRTRTVRRSFLNLRCRPTVVSARETQPERGRSRLLTGTDEASPMTQAIAATTSNDIEKKDAHLSGTAEQAQADGEPSITSHQVNNGTPPGAESQASTVAEPTEQKQKKGNEGHKSFAKSVANKIRKLAHPKKCPTD